VKKKKKNNKKKRNTMGRVVSDDCILVLAFSFSRFDVFALASQYLMVLVLIFLTEVL
jgi:hypothetical protein